MKRHSGNLVSSCPVRSVLRLWAGSWPNYWLCRTVQFGFETCSLLHGARTKPGVYGLCLALSFLELAMSQQLEVGITIMVRCLDSLLLTQPKGINVLRLWET